MSDPYVVAIKPSARRANGTVGRLVHEEGAVREFDSRALAEAWADGVSRGGGHVWIRDANPNDEAADGYLMSRGDRPKRAGTDDGPLRGFESATRRE
ncbi:MAG: hypothetical protein ACI9YT_000490 [Halobacteriales archaeon]